MQYDFSLVFQTSNIKFLFHRFLIYWFFHPPSKNIIYFLCGSNNLIHVHPLFFCHIFMDKDW